MTEQPLTKQEIEEALRVCNTKPITQLGRLPEDEEEAIRQVLRVAPRALRELLKGKEEREYIVRFVVQRTIPVLPVSAETRLSLEDQAVKNICAAIDAARRKG